MSGYASGYISFFLTTKPVKGIAGQMSTNYICREEYIDMFKFSILRQLGCKPKGDEFDTAKQGDLKCSTRKAYVGVKATSSSNEGAFIDSMMIGLDAINVLEERNGWPLTVMYRVTNRNAVLFCGTNKWIKSPFALSLYTLLMRIGETRIMKDMYDDIPDKYERYDRFVSSMKKVNKPIFNSTGRFAPIIKTVNYNDNRTLYRVVETIHFWDLFMENYDTLFKGRSFLSNYGYKSVNEFYNNNKKAYSYSSIHMSEANGLFSLVNNETVDLEMRRRFKKLTGDI